MKISSLLSLWQEQVLHLLAVTLQSCFLKAEILPASQAVALLPVASSQKACGVSSCACVMEKEGRKARQYRLKIMRAGLGCRIWEKTTFSRCCIIKANITGSSLTQPMGLKPFSKQPLFSLFFQPWPFEPSLNSPSLVHTSPGFFLPLLFFLLVCLESLGLCGRHQITLNFSHITFTQKTGKMWVSFGDLNVKSIKTTK